MKYQIEIRTASNDTSINVIDITTKDPDMLYTIATSIDKEKHITGWTMKEYDNNVFVGEYGSSHPINAAAFLFESIEELPQV